MVALIIFLLSIVLGVGIVRQIPLSMWSLERYAWVGVLGIAVSSWIFFITTWLIAFPGGLITGVVVHILLIAICMIKAPRGETISYSGQSILLLIPITLVLYLLHTHMLLPSQYGWHSAGGAWGDLALHTALITHFSEQVLTRLDFSLLHNGSLTYPFMLDFYSSTLERLGLSLRWSLLLPAGVLAASLITIFWFFVLRMGKSATAATLSVLLFLFAGSSAATWYFIQDFFKNPSLEFLNRLPADYANMADKGLQFSNTITTILIPQRTVLLGFPLVLIAAILLWQWYEKREYWSLWVAAIIIGGLPFVHIHGFIFSILLLAWVLLITMSFSEFLRRGLGVIGLLLVLAAPQLWWQWPSESFSYWHVGWVAEMPRDALEIFLKNFGVLILALVPALVYVWKKQRTLLLFLIPFVGIFLLTQVYIFQPNPYDNIKFIMLGLLGMSVIISLWAIHSPGFRIIQLLLIVLLLAPGILSVIWEEQQEPVLYSNSDIALAEWVREKTDPDSVFLTSPMMHNHPIPALSGRSVLLGYPGWLWTYGIPIDHIQEEYPELFSGQKEVLDTYGITHVVIGPAEIRDYGAAVGNFPNAKIVYQRDQWTILER